MNLTKVLETVAINLVSEALTSSGKVHYKEGAKKSIFGRPFVFKGGEWVLERNENNFPVESKKYNLPNFEKVEKALHDIHRSIGGDFYKIHDSAYDFITTGNKTGVTHTHPIIKQARTAYEKLKPDVQKSYRLDLEHIEPPNTLSLSRPTWDTVRGQRKNISVGNKKIPDFSIKHYPKLYQYMKKQGHDSTFHPNNLPKINPKLQAEKIAVYKTLTDNGPDLDFGKLGKHLPKIRKKAGSILEAYEKDTLYDHLNDLGFFGHSSDSMRNDADKYF